jgi:ABC-type sugar transport system permease subunit
LRQDTRPVRDFITRHQYLFFIGPPVLYVAMLTLYPALYGVVISFTNINIGYKDWRFIGLDNYIRLFSWDRLPLVGWNTLVFVVSVTALQIVIGFTIALLLNQRMPFRRTVRSIAVLPWIVPSIVVALLFQQIFNGSPVGIANALVMGMGGEPKVWLADPNSAMLVMIGTQVWRGVPLTIILLLGGLQSIPRDLYEASRIDGAGPLKSFMYVTLPLMKPTLMVNLIWITSGNLNQLDIPFGLTGGGPSHKTEVIAVTLYDQAFRLLDAGFASSIATIVLVFNVIMTVLYLNLLRSPK